MNTEYKIYQILDIDNKIIYIGITKLNLEERFRRHKYNLNNNYIKLLCNTYNREFESIVIKYYTSKGINLLNKNKGIGNIDNIKEYQNEYRKNNKYYFNEYRENNKEKIKINDKEYKLKNKEKIKLYQKEYRENKKQLII